MATNLYAFKSSQAAGSKILPPENITVINGDFTFSGNLQINGNINATGNISATGNITANGTIMGSNTSHIGMIIHSTTLATMEDVIAQYGGTTWIQHSGYFLRGGTTDNITPRSQTSDGGSDDAIVVAHSHGHTLSTGSNSHSHNPSSGSNFVAFTGTASSETVGTIAGSGYKLRQIREGDTWYNARTNTVSHSHSVVGSILSQGSSGTGGNVPKYKNVYIWERTA